MIVIASAAKQSGVFLDCSVAFGCSQ